MPKELVHVLLARDVAARLAGTAWAGPLGACPNALAWGAVFPDFLYYPAGLATPDWARRSAAVLHGAAGGDLLGPARAALDAAGTQPDPRPWRAFAAGLASHVFGDAALHPAVEAATGDWDHPDPARRTDIRRAHYRLETLLDLALAGPAMVREFSFRKALSGLEADAAALHRAAWHGLPGGTQGCGRDALTAWSLRAGISFALLHGLFAWPPAARLAHALAPRLPAPLRRDAALFYAPQLEREAAALDPAPWRGRCAEAAAGAARWLAGEAS